MLSPGHGYRIIEDVGGCKPRLDLGIALTRTVLIEDGRLRVMVAEAYHWWVLVACNSGDLG